MWTEERVDTLKRLWAEGLSASQIATRLGDVTRNSVIGKVHGLGLPGRRTTTWTSERVETLKKLWAEGVSARDIANRLGSATKSSVISKAHGLKLPGRKAIICQRSPGTRGPRSKKNYTNRTPRGTPFAGFYGTYEPFVPTEELVIPEAERAYVLTLRECNCRWPIGDPQHQDFHFCGKDKIKGYPYCEFHCRKAFQPPSSAQKWETLVTY